MRCDFVMLSRYLDSDLDWDERAKLENHLTSCLPCRRELRELQQVDTAVSTLRRRHRPVPGELDARIHREVHGRRRRPVRASRLSSPAVGSAAAALLLFLGSSHGILFPAGHNAAASPSVVRQRVAQLSAPLAQSRRASAILDGHVSSALNTSLRHRQTVVE